MITKFKRIKRKVLIYIIEKQNIPPVKGTLKNEKRSLENDNGQKTIKFYQ